MSISPETPANMQSEINPNNVHVAPTRAERLNTVLVIFLGTDALAAALYAGTQEAKTSIALVLGGALIGGGIYAVSDPNNPNIRKS